MGQCGRKRIVFSAALLVLGLLGVDASAQPGAPPEGSRTAALHKAIRDENHAEARRLADAMLKSANQNERAAAAAAYGRVLLSLGEKERARQYLGFMANQKLEGDATEVMKVYAAWLAALEGNSDEAVKTLEPMLADAPHGPAPVEAADVLAQLHLARGDRAAAGKAIDYGLWCLKYQELKHPYVERLLRNRLAVDPDEAYPEAKKLYEQAEKLRREGKPAEAGKLFTEVRAKYPLSTWSDAAGYRIGQCLEMLGRTAQAEQHWNAFADHQPGGPWRGQTRVGLVHLVLIARGDLKAAAQHAHAARKVLEAGVDEPAAPSWQSAAAGIHLSRGMVALLEARHADASAALRDARDTASVQEEQSSARFLAGLDRLITGAERREEVIPARLAVPDDRLRLALSVGTIDNLLGRFEHAGRAFDHVLQTPMRLAHQPHRSFAALGKARSLVGLNVEGTRRVPSPDQPNDSAAALTAAKTAYLLSLSALLDAPWHEHALRELALVIEQLAALHAEALPAGPSANVAGTRRVPSAPTPAQARAALEAARCEALPHWQALLERFPESPHVPQALYHAGVLHAEGAKPAPERSVAAFERLTKQFPASPWTGDAHVRLIDVKLERQFDLPSATLHARAAADWLANVAATNVEGTRRVPLDLGPPSASAGTGPVRTTLNDGAKSVPVALNDGTAPVPSTLLLDDLFSLSLPSLERTSYAIYLRAGLVAYLSERPAEAVEWFERAKPFEPERSFVVVHGHIPTGIERLIDVAKSGKTVTPEEARRGDERARLILMLADVFLESSVHEKALELATAVIDKPKGAATPAQRSWAHRQRAVAYGHLGPEAKEDARREYMAAQQAGPTAPWAPECLLVAGTILHNHETRRQEAVAVFEDVVRRYPASESAAKAAYFVGVLHEWNSEWKQAKAAYQRVVRDYPQSRWASAAMNYHLKKVDAALAAPTADTTPGR